MVSLIRQTYANQLRRRRAQPGDKWHLDEVFLRINGKTSYLWRAVDQQGNVLDILVQSRRNKAAVKKFFRKLLKGCQYVPRVMITDKLGSYGAAKKIVSRSEQVDNARVRETDHAAHWTRKWENAVRLTNTGAAPAPHCVSGLAPPVGRAPRPRGTSTMPSRMP